MTEIFRIIEQRDKNNDTERKIGVGIDIKIGGQEISCPISGTYGSYEEFGSEIEAIQKDLERILQKAKALFEGPPAKDIPAIKPHMSSEEIWGVLSQIEDEGLFVESFNGIEESKRKAVAEYVLSRCNIFSGKGAAFSRHYDAETGFLN